MEKYVEMLKEKDLKVTHHRIAILKYLDKHRTHPTADEIYTELKKTNPSLSKTTVYNSLETLKLEGIIQNLSICATEARYDFNKDMHHHFLCTKCNRIYDIDFKCPNVEKIRHEIQSEGHKITEVHGYFKGICKNCIKKKTDEKNE